MAKTIVRRVDRNLARRLREARREAGLSTRAVSGRLPRRLAVSHTTLASYENGVTVPPVDILAALADLYRRPLNWFLETRESLGCFRYRNLPSRVPLAERRQFEALAGKWADAYLNLQRHLNTRVRIARPIDLKENESSPTALAATVRRELLNLDDDDPILNVIVVLESFSASALEIKPSFEIDGATASHGDEFVVIVNPSVANVRVRMNAAIELGHVLYGESKQRLGLDDRDIEKRAYAFASSLLLPESQLKTAFENKAFLRLIQFKEKFGISLAAMVYMAEQSRIINTTTSRWLWREMSRRGWRQTEPGYVWRDRAINFETLLEGAIESKSLTWADAERITGIREDELRERISNVTQPDEPRLIEVPSLKIASL